MAESTPESRIRDSWTVQATAGEPFAVVSVRNLQAVVVAGRDAWGRSGKAQPLLVSAEVSFSQPFAAASASDSVGPDTVHYGTLSKTILGSLEYYSPQNTVVTPSRRAASSLRDVLERIWLTLTGLQVDGNTLETEEKKMPFLDISRLRSLSVSVCLPKATLLGDQVGLTAMSVFAVDKTGPRVDMFGLALHLRNLRVPTLIGVNSNERLFKQAVLASVEIDKCYTGLDLYTALESLVVKAMEESSFETLEALAAHLANKIMTDFMVSLANEYSGCYEWQVKITLQKPVAVPFADCPVVEIRAGGNAPPLSLPGQVHPR